jgi:phosphoribosyl-dephospho-CoA transferase
MMTILPGLPVAAAPPPALPSTLRRHQLIRLSGAGWARVMDAPWDSGARSCLGLWAARGLPLVVTRQPAGATGSVACGLPAPSRYRRRRLSLAIAAGDVMFLDEFPSAADAARLLPRAAQAPWRTLLATLAAADCTPRVYGGYGWQRLTRLAYVHADSDIDLLLPVTGVECADAVCRALAAAPAVGPRLDGELLLPDGGAVAWREWLDYRAGRVAQAIVKRLRGVALERPGFPGESAC